MHKPPYKFSPDQLQLHAVWLKANTEGELFIPCGGKANATKLRFALYNSVKPFREGRAENPEMVEAIAAVSITLEGDGVRLQHRSASVIMQSVRAVLGDAPIPEQQIMTQEEMESQRRLQELLSTPKDGPVVANPYLTPREER